MSREQFFGRLAALDQERLQKVLWNLYWRGSAQMRQRIEVELDPEPAARRAATAKTEVDPAAVLLEVREFDELARAGAYLGGDRRVSPKERSRWRFTFQGLVGRARDALLADVDGTSGAEAVATLIDLACAMRDFDYFRSDDPVEAARFVVSDAVAMLWRMALERYGFSGFAERAAPQLLRWESRYGWTRRGYGRVSDKESTLATVLVPMLPVPDTWLEFADCYLDALDNITDGAAPGRSLRSAPLARNRRAGDLAKWNEILLHRLVDYDGGERLDRLAGHQALAGPELTFLQAQLARRRGDVKSAGDLVRQGLDELPGHSKMRDFAAEIGMDTR